MKILEAALVVLLIAGSVSAQSINVKPGDGYEFPDNGKHKGAMFGQMYEQRVPEYDLIEFSANLDKGVALNLDLLERLPESRTFKAGNLDISVSQMKRVSRIIKEAADRKSPVPLKSLKYYQIKGEDGLGNVHFTGYFTPVLMVRNRADSRFRYPLYALPPDKSRFSRTDIDFKGALAGMNLELAFSDSLLDNFFLSVQGSGILDYGDGIEKMVGYAGSNGHKYRSLGRMLVDNGSIPAEKISLRTIRAWFDKHPQQLVPMLQQNPSYTFFKWRREAVTGAAGTPLAAGHSVAVDRSCIPYGSCLLAEIPILDEHGVLKCHQWRFLFAHDTGGAIIGPGHLDLYHGIGKEAGEMAGDLHHYGRVWLIMPD